MNSVAYLYALSVASVLSLSYALVKQDWFAAFVAVILFVLVAAWFLYNLKVTR